MANTNIGVNYKNVPYIDTTPSSTPTWAELQEGFDNVSESLNEIVETKSWLNDKGWGRSFVNGGQLTFTLSGYRVYGNAAQDYIFSDAVKYAFANARTTNFKIDRVNVATNAVVSTVTISVTITKISDNLGQSQSGTAIAVDFAGNGEPTTALAYTAAQTLTVVSLAGTGTGKTSIYVNPVKGASNSLKYKITSTLPVIGSVLTTGWTGFTAGADAVSTGLSTGDIIVVAEVLTADNTLLKAGTCTVTVG